jgi:hypothetical protein
MFRKDLNKKGKKQSLPFIINQHSMIVSKQQRLTALTIYLTDK